MRLDLSYALFWISLAVSAAMVPAFLFLLRKPPKPPAPPREKEEGRRQ